MIRDDLLLEFEGLQDLLGSYVEDDDGTYFRCDSDGFEVDGICSDEFESLVSEYHDLERQVFK